MGNKPKKHKVSKLPSKKTMNLYQIEITDNSWQRVIPYALLIIVIVAAFAQFGVFQRISQLNKLSEQVSKAQIQLEKLNKSIEDYDDVKTEYIRYTDDYMLEEEGKLVDRMKIIGLIGDKVSNIGEVKSYAIADNTVSLEVVVDTLDDVRRIRKQLDEVDWVGNITVNTATKSISAAGGGEVVASIVFDVIYQGESEEPVDASGTAEAADGEGVDD
ncbi:MAG: hypothetical protein ACOX3P_04030 [Saccharofermentanales bacterium]|mgnify:CR=1 FL=1|jgi:hypothetical protein|nr:hypothetical protein [Bacillota bacterium]NLB08171.1 hypothetical protein [Clostridiales bacterium]